MTNVNDSVLIAFVDRTALHWAAKRGHRDIVQVLLDCGADTAVVNSKGETAANLAVDSSLAQLLGGLKVLDTPSPELPSSTPNYLAHPPLAPKIDTGAVVTQPIKTQHAAPAVVMSSKPHCTCALHAEGE